MYDPATLVVSFPSYRGRLYRLAPFIGFDIWHIDPEQYSEGQRTDDSCGWFDRRPHEYADAVNYLLSDESTVHEIKLIILKRKDTPAAFYEGVSKKQISYPRLSAADTLALCLLVARELETRRWWNGQNGKEGASRSRWRRAFSRRRNVGDVATTLALNPLDNLSSVEEPELAVRLIAGALHRHFKPWWKHPRWHVHHWKINFALPRNIRRALFTKCETCGKRLGWNYTPTDNGNGVHRCE